MQELAQINKNQVLKHKSGSYSKGIQKVNSSLILPLLSTLGEKDLNPYWNSQCEAVQSMLWLPQKIDSPDLGFNSLNGTLNYKEDASKFWKTTITPLNHLIQQNLSVLLPLSVTPTMGSDQLKGGKINNKSKLPNGVIIGTSKIRFYPENPVAYNEALALYRRSYNLAVSKFLNEDYKDTEGKFVNMRPEIKEQVKQEQIENNRVYNSIISDSGTLRAGVTFNAVCSNNKKLKGSKSGFSSLSFKSRKGTKHSFSIDRMPVGGNPCVRVLGQIHLTEKLPKEAIDKTATVTLDKGRWFIQVQKHIQIQSEIQGRVKCVGIDPGVRTFATCFSETECVIAGDSFAKTKLNPLMLKVDKLLSRKTKVLHSIKELEKEPQWATDTLNYLNKEINKLKCKKEDIVSDLHSRLAFELIKDYDVIFLPTFETKQMVKRKGKVRTIRRNTCRQMLDLGHYSFKMKIKWLAKKYGKHVVDVNESYTSKTRSWDGTIDAKLGSKKIIKGSGFKVDRDINAARGILLKHLTRL
jgi:putative transposase